MTTSLGLFFPNTSLKPISCKHTNMFMNLQITHNNGKVPLKLVLSLEFNLPPNLKIILKVLSRRQKEDYSKALRRAQEMTCIDFDDI